MPSPLNLVAAHRHRGRAIFAARAAGRPWSKIASDFAITEEEARQATIEAQVERGDRNPRGLRIF